MDDQHFVLMLTLGGQAMIQRQIEWNCLSISIFVSATSRKDWTTREKKLAVEFMRHIFTNELSFLKTISIWKYGYSPGTHLA